LVAASTVAGILTSAVLCAWLGWSGLPVAWPGLAVGAVAGIAGCVRVRRLNTHRSVVVAGPTD
jgi:hypothetical protein